MLMRNRMRDERGFSLVELLVVMILTGVIGGVVVAAVTSGFRTSATAESRIDAINDLQRGIQRIGRELRVADPLVFQAAPLGDPQPAFSEEVRAEVERDGQRTRYRYYLVDVGDGVAELREDVQRLDGSGNVLSSNDGLFIADVANLTTGTKLFSYYTTDLDTGELEEIPCDDATDQVCRDRHLTATQIEMRLEKLLPRQPPVQLQTIVNVRNTRFEEPSA